MTMLEEKAPAPESAVGKSVEDMIEEKFRSNEPANEPAIDKPTIIDDKKETEPGTLVTDLPQDEGQVEEPADRVTKLAVATAVDTEEDDENLPRAVEHDPDSKPSTFRNRRFKIYSIAALVIIVVVVVVAVVVTVFAVDDDEDEVDRSPTSTPSSFRETLDFMSKFQEVVSEDDLDNLNSPQRMAADWIIVNDPKQMEPADEGIIQRFVLASFYYSTSVENPWKSCNPPIEGEDNSCLYGIHPEEATDEMVKTKRWLTDAHECDWAGVVCDDDGIVNGLQLFENELEGTIPDELSRLTGLQAISLYGNNLYGKLPASLAGLENLIDIELRSNYLSGSIPSAYWTMSQAALLDFARNDFTGSIPAEVSQLKNINYLFFDNTVMDGVIPPTIGELDKLIVFRSSSNGHTGPIPTEIGLLVNLEQLQLHKNGLTDGIPTEIGNLVKLSDLRLHTNDIGGPIPDEFYNLVNLEKAYLFDMGLTGTLSTSIGDMKSLVHLVLKSNFLNGTIPTELALIPPLQILWLYWNDFEGAVPDELCQKSPPIPDLTSDCRDVLGPAKNECSCCFACCDDSGICMKMDADL